MKLNCSQCGNEFTMSLGHYNRAVKVGAKGFYCNKMCCGLARRLNRSIEEKKKIKSEYDKARIYTEKEKQQRHEWFKKDYAANPEKYKKERQRKYQKHLEYLGTDKYKAWKKAYDESYRAKINYGEFSEAFLILKQIENILESQLIKRENGITFNKSSQQRKRKWKNLQVKT